MPNGLTLTFTGNPTINIGVGADELTAIKAQITALEATMTQSFDTAGAALDAIQAGEAELAAAAASDRAAFDTLAADVRAFIASVQAAGALSVEDSAKADAILASLGVDTAAETQEASDEAALSAEVQGA